MCWFLFSLRGQEPFTSLPLRLRVDLHVAVVLHGKGVTDVRGVFADGIWFQLKVPPQKVLLAQAAHIVGIRTEESRKRAARHKIDLHTKILSIDIKPIFYWKEFHVWEFIEKYKLPYPSLYDEGFDRIGCVVCPMMFHKNQAKLNKHRERWPGKFRAFERAVEKWYNKKQFTDCKHGSFKEYMHNYYHGFELKKTDTQQKDLFDS